MLDRWRARWPWFDAFMRMNERFGAVGGGPLSSSIALASFLSLFPLLLVGIAVVGFISSGDAGFADRMVRELGLEGRTAEVVHDAIGTAEGSRRAATVIGVAGLLWSGLGLVGALQTAINAVWQETGRGLLDKLVALRWLVGAAVLFAGGWGLGALLNVVPWFAAPVTVVAGLAVSLALFLWTYTSLGHTHGGWRAHLPGALLVAVAFEVMKAFGSLYVPRLVSSSSGLYGSLGIVFALLAWFAIYARLIVYGAVVNVLRWEGARGTDVVTIEVPHHDGPLPTSVNRGGAIQDHAVGPDADPAAEPAT